MNQLSGVIYCIVLIFWPTMAKPLLSGKAKMTELNAVSASNGPITISVSGHIEPNDGLRDLVLLIRLHNKGAEKVAMLDGGTTIKPMRGAYFIEADEQGVVTLVQKAYPLPDPSPTIPITPAATLLAPNQSSEVKWRATMEAIGLNQPYMGHPGASQKYSIPVPITHIRVCVAYKKFDSSAFEPIKARKGFYMPIGAIDQQQSMVCSPTLELPKVVR